MTEPTTFLALLAAAISLGVIHTLAPDHWVPIAAVAKARNLGRGGTARLALACGGLHVGVSALFAVAGAVWGRELVAAAGLRLEAASGALLVILALTWLAWTVHRLWIRRIDAVADAVADAGADAVADADADASSWSTAGLLAFFAANPCVPLVPLAATAALLGPAELVALITLYGVGTLLTMTALALPAGAGLGLLGGRWGQLGGPAVTLGVALLVLVVGL